MENTLKLVYTLGKHIGDELTLRELAHLAQVPYTTASRSIKSADIFTLNKKGNIILCSLSRQDPLIKSYLIISERQAQKEFTKKNPGYRVMVDYIEDDKICIILFGSRADNAAREKSDVDICVIGSDRKKRPGFSKFEMLYGLEVNALFFSEKEFSLMLKDKEENIAKQIIKKHIILYGETYFWEVVWDGIC